MFVLYKAAGLIAYVSAVVMALIVAGVVLRRRGLALTGVAILLLIVLLPIDDLASRPLEDRYVRPEVARVDGLVVLGGAVDEQTSIDRGTPSMAPAASRLFEMAVLARRWPQARIVFAGGSGLVAPGALVEADIVAGMLPGLGIDVARVALDRRSRTTAENATEARRVAQPRPGSCWLLVTSAIHMPRAMAEFAAAGFAVAPWPVGYSTRAHRFSWLESPGERLTRTDAAAHEWIGLLASLLRHRALHGAAAGPDAACSTRGAP